MNAPQPPANERRSAAAVDAQYEAEAAEAHGDVTVDELDLAAELAGAGGTASADVAEYALRLGDDALILSLHYAGTASGRSEDDLAYWRDEPEFRCAWLFQQPNGDFAHTIARGLIASAYLQELYAALSSSTDATLAAIAAKAVKEVAYHRDHAVQWTLRLAGGTEESRARMLVALTDTWPYIDELFRDDALTERLAGVVPAPSSLRPAFDEVLGAVLAEAEIAEADFTNRKIGQSSGGGRHGNHSTHLGPLLAEMQVLARRHPGATW